MSQLPTANRPAPRTVRQDVTDPDGPPAAPEVQATASDVTTSTRRTRLDGLAQPEFGGDAFDRMLHFVQSRFTLGLSPTSLALAYVDWSLHLASSPGKQMLLWEKWWRQWLVTLQEFATSGAVGDQHHAGIQDGRHDPRFAAPEWHRPPFESIHDAFLLLEDWWQDATTGVRGITPQHERLVSFMARQFLDVLSPANFMVTNPLVLQRTMESGGANLIAGAANFFEDWGRAVTGRPPVGIENFKIGENLAVTPGRVVYRNELIELIQYEATTARVKSEPILFVPAWIMKYYILDLSPNNSMVRYLVDQGYTVFMISWRNPTREQRDYGFHEYMTLGVEAALAEVERLVRAPSVHVVGYCLGGTLLSMVAAAMARGDGARNRAFRTLTLLAAQVDFTDAGELTLFTTPSQLAFLNDVMEVQGFLSARQMAGAFQMLRSNDLIWSRVVESYLMGTRKAAFDLMAWNADATRMPARMHSEYLRHMFLNNDLAEGRYEVDGKPIAITDIRAPIFAVGTESDHVAPWHSVYKIRLLSDTEVTFLLTSGGHNAGIVCPAAHDGRHYRISTAPADAAYMDPESWKRETPLTKGSWWPEWRHWLDLHSSGETAPPALGSLTEHGMPQMAAPGSYVREH